MEVLGIIDVPVSLFCAIVLSVLIYLYLTKDFGYWKSKGIPFAKPYPIVGSMGSFLLKPFHTEELKRYKKYGRIHGGFDGNVPYISIGDPNLLKNIMVKDFMYFPERRDVHSGNEVPDNFISILTGDDWKRVRTIVTPVFTSGKLRKLYNIMNDSCTTLRDNLMTQTRKGKPANILDFLGAYAMDVILSTAFATKVDSLNDQSNRLVNMAKVIFRQTWRFFAFFLFPGLMKLLHVEAFHSDASAYLKNFTLQLIKERRQSGKKKNDFLQLLLDAAEETHVEDDVDKTWSKMAHEEKNAEIFKPTERAKSLSNDEIVSQSVLFMAAGYDTLTTTLSLAAYNLALNPNCQENLIKELDEAYGKNSHIDYDALQSLKYLDAIVNETLRMYPAVVRAERRCMQDYKLQGKEITIPKYMIVGIPIYAMHHDPEFFPEPERFKPERFFPENKSNITPYTYLPFGLGPRNCVGMRYALMEMKICLANILRQFRFKRCPETKVPGDFTPGNVLIAPKSIMLKIEVRSDTLAF